MIKLYLVRHGETVANKAHILQGQTDGELNETGRAQAREVREKMKGSAIDVYVASDLQRAVETCRIIAGDDRKNVVTTLKSRARNFLTWLKVTYPDKTVLAVGHGIINKAIQSVYFRKPMNEIEKMTNAEVRVLML